VETPIKTLETKLRLMADDAPSLIYNCQHS